MRCGPLLHYKDILNHHHLSSRCSRLDLAFRKHALRFNDMVVIENEAKTDPLMLQTLESVDGRQRVCSRTSNLLFFFPSLDLEPSAYPASPGPLHRKLTLLVCKTITESSFFHFIQPLSLSFSLTHITGPLAHGVPAGVHCHHASRHHCLHRGNAAPAGRLRPSRVPAVRFWELR